MQFEFSSEQEDELKNDHSENKGFEIADLVVVGVVTILYFGILGYHIYKRDYFPIKERSAWLTLTMGVSNYSGLVFLLLLYFNNEDCINFQSQTFLQCGKCVEPEDELKLNKYLTLPYLFVRIYQISAYYLRTLKIGLVFSHQTQNKLTNFIFIKEYRQIIVALILSLGFVSLFYFTNFIPFIFWSYEKEDWSESVQELKNQRYQWISFQLLNMVALLICYYFSKNVIRSYGLQTEVFIIFVIQFVYTNINMASSYYLNLACATIGGNQFYLSLLFIILQDVFNFLLTTAYPLFFLLGQGNFMPPIVALLDFKSFIVDEQYFIIFYYYCKYLEQCSLYYSPGDKPSHRFATKILILYNGLKMMNPEDMDAQKSKEFLEENFSENLEFAKFIPEQVRGNTYVIEGNSVIIHDIRDNLRDEFENLYIFLGQELSSIFQEYKKTASYLYLRNYTTYHDKINETLFKWNMIAIDS